MYCDILVIGAGILGLSSAYHLKSQNPNKRILVIDKLSGPGQGNTAKSAGGFRNLFTSKTNYLLANSTINWFDHLQNDLNYDLKFAYTGYLYLYSKFQYSHLRKSFDKMKSKGIEFRTFEKDELRHLIPDLVTNFEGDKEAELMGLEPVEIGVLGVKCGTINTDAIARCYEAEFLKIGGEVKYNIIANRLITRPEKEFGIPGEPFIWQDVVVAGTNTNYGEINAKRTVVAAGVWSERLLDPIGFDSMIRPKTRVIFVFKDQKLERLLHLKGMNNYGFLPHTHLTNTKLYLIGDLTEKSIWLGCAEDFGRKYGLEDDPKPNEHLYSKNAYHALVKYLPCFKDVRPINMWAGQRAINRFDSIPIVTSAPGMIYVGAATGNGILKCDALGRIVAALYSDENETILYSGYNFKVSDLGIANRNVEKEKF